MDFKGLSDPVVLTNDSTKKPGFFSRIRPPKTDFFKNKKFFGGALTVMLLFAVGIGVYLSQKPTQLTPHASEPETETSINPSNTPVASESAFFSPNTNISSKGDGNGDGKIDFQDLSVLYSKSTPAMDFNDDNKIDSFDIEALNDLLKRQGIIQSSN